MLQNIRRNAFDKPLNKELKMIVKHPGLRIKEELLPKGMTVTEAAKLLAIGRPALSNFLMVKQCCHLTWLSGYQRPLTSH